MKENQIDKGCVMGDGSIMDIRNNFSASILNWIILTDMIKETPCSKELYIKLLQDYLPFMPAYKVSELIKYAAAYVSILDHQAILEELWKQITILDKN